MLADKAGVLAKRHKPAKSGLIGIIDRAIFTRPAAEVLFQAQRIERAQPHMAHVELCARGPKGLIDVALKLRLHPDFIPQIACETDAPHQSGCHGNVHPGNVHKAEPARADIMVSQLFKNAPRVGARD